MARAVSLPASSIASKRLIPDFASESGVSRHARSLVEAARLDSKIDLPYSRSKVAEALGLTLIEDPSIAPRLGAYSPDPPTIFINPQIWVDRAEFTFYHEVVHHLLTRDKSFISYLHDAVSDNNAFDRAIERACNIGAAEFLLPHSQVLDLASNSEWNAHLIRKLHQSFPASWIACVLQIASVAPHACVGVVCGAGSSAQVHSRQLLPSSGQSSDHLVILHSVSSQSMRYSVARSTVVPGAPSALR